MTIFVTEERRMTVIVLLLGQDRRAPAVVAPQINHRVGLGSTDHTGARDAAARTDDGTRRRTLGHISPSPH